MARSFCQPSLSLTGWAEGRIGNHPVVQGLLPELLETAFRVRIPNAFATPCGRSPGRVSLADRPAAPALRGRTGLGTAARSTAGRSMPSRRRLGVAPRFQVMGLGQVPVALVRGLIDEQAVVNAEGNFCRCSTKFRSAGAV